nr:Chain C, LPEP peptide from EBV, P10A, LPEPLPQGQATAY [synthetic construct]
LPEPLPQGQATAY